MTCPNCPTTLPGCYDFKCVQCCARLIRNSSPNKQRQEAMFAVIEKTPGAPARDEIDSALAELECKS